MALEHPYIRIANVTPEKMDEKEGWNVSDFRVVVSGKEGSSSIMYHATLAPGDRHHKHRYENCDMQYYVVSGHGLAGAGADRAEVHAGHFHLIPKGVEHWLVNLGRHDPLVIIGFYDRAPYLKDTGHVYLGNITEADLAAPRTLSAAALQSRSCTTIRFPTSRCRKKKAGRRITSTNRSIAASARARAGCRATSAPTPCT